MTARTVSTLGLLAIVAGCGVHEGPLAFWLLVGGFVAFAAGTAVGFRRGGPPWGTA